MKIANVEGTPKFKSSFYLCAGNKRPAEDVGKTSFKMTKEYLLRIEALSKTGILFYSQELFQIMFIANLVPMDLQKIYLGSIILAEADDCNSHNIPEIAALTKNCF